MSDETSTSPADTQAPPPQSDDTATGQASEPVTPPTTEPATTVTSPETAVPKIVPEPEAPKVESAPEVPPVAVEAPRENENLEAVKDTSPQNTPVVTPEPVASQSPTPEISPPVSVPISNQNTPQVNRGNLPKARAKIQDTKRQKLDKIMVRLAEKNRISNDEVEKLLRVSDATATRYLSVLEKENRIKQAGRTGKSVFYEKI